MEADSDSAVRRAARLADTWYINPHAKLETLERQMTLYREMLAERGKPFPQEIPIRRELFVARDRDMALRTCLPYLRRKYQTRILGSVQGATTGRHARPPFRRVTRSAVHHREPR